MAKKEANSEKQKRKINFKNIRWKKIIKYGIILIVIVLIISKAIGYFKPSGHQVQTEVQTSAVAAGNIESMLSGKGTIEPLDKYEVNALVKGEVLDAPFEEGDMVKKGDILYQISTKDVENSIENASLSLQKAEKTYNDTLTKLGELEGTAKISGYVKKLYVKTGDSIQTGTNIADIYDGDYMYLDVPFLSSLVNDGLIGKKASISMATTMEVLNGTVTAVNDMEETLPGSISVKKVTVKVKNPGGLTVGDTALASIGKEQCAGSGTFRAGIEQTITAEGSGKISTLNLKEGKYMKKGSVIYTFSSKDADNAIEDSKLTLKEAELALKNQKNQLDNYSIKSPISGQVILKNKKKGDTIDPSTDSAKGALAIVYDLSAMTFRMNVDELQIRNISVGQTVKITADALPGEEIEGKVEKIGLNSTTTNGVSTYPVTIRIDKIGNLLPGMNITGKIITAKADNVLTIPAGAVMRDNVVYVKSAQKEAQEGKSKAVSADGVPEGFREVKVEVGISDGTNVEIKSGLKEGDEVYIPYVDTSGTGAGGMGYYYSSDTETVTE
ncbi:efflux RND transporter periplasmic adaptor subunit [Anaerocolumna xylanovorans]|uniref:HlyD family secretion protein n=1 Tax=Anaerocolumna xylanovorans DSM 12503 TaxID=1121345 RepID=A0A1M7YN59_9FIRM|nr:efflux RND transporter periplasmic adaptor subunit [Anaerocolumna xylanovorans]SHO53976.1 HlyD family secretion protein [Anaerocolumna xylanovorans DSM 12503]